MDLNQAFKSTCKVLFGQEIGELSEFEQYLSETMFPYRTANSDISGKEVLVSIPHYPQESKFISQDEITKVKFEPLNINEIKDIDSLLEAAEERAIFCGNKIFGKCENVERVDNCIDCSNIKKGHNIWQVKNGSNISYMRESEYVFGVSAFPKSKYSIRCLEGVNSTRCFESYYSSKISDLFYAFNCVGCQDCIFAFNLRSKRYNIGNLQLEKGKYVELKKKLVTEIAEKLQKNKRAWSISDIANHRLSKKEIETEISYPYSPVPRKVEEAFNKTTEIVFGKERKNIQNFGPWLLRRAMDPKKIKGAFGNSTYKVNLPIVKDISASRLVTLKEALKTAERTVSEKELEEITIVKMIDYASKDAYFTFEFVDGYNEDTVDTSAIFTAMHTYRCWDCTNSKYAGFASTAIESEYIFGGGLRILHSHFCINCYDPFNCKGCFEVDSSTNCYNSYFCHNCENLDNGIFCFNVKSKRYAVLNQEVGREEFLRIKKMLLDYLNKQLDENATIKEDVFRIQV